MDMNLGEIKAILSKYETQYDIKLFIDTVDELFRVGIAKGCYQDYSVLIDVTSILICCGHKLNDKDY